VVEDPEGLAATEGTMVGMVDTEGIMVDMEDIEGIMAGMEDIMVEAISTEVRVSLSADIMGTPITIRTGIILTLIITRHLITILINRMPRDG